MLFHDFEKICQRAWENTLQLPKILFTSLAIFLCGLIALFGMAISVTSEPWMSLSVFFISIVSFLAVLTGLGVFLIRSSQSKQSIKEIFFSSWDKALGASLFFMPLFVGFLLIWACMGIFLLIQSLPFIGQVLSIFFAFVPFLLLFVSLALVFMSVYLMFSLTPLLAQNSLFQFSHLFRHAFQFGFTRLASFGVSLAFVLFSAFFIWVAAACSMQFFLEASSHLQRTMQALFVMLPVSILLAPSVLFFFNMAASAEGYVQKEKSE